MIMMMMMTTVEMTCLVFQPALFPFFIILTYPVIMIVIVVILVLDFLVDWNAAFVDTHGFNPKIVS